MATNEWVDKLLQRRRARLFPVVKEKQLENKTLAIFLAVFSQVFELRRNMMRTIDEPISQSTKVDCLTEVKPPRPIPDMRHSTPDGLIRFRRGNKIWQAFVEAKINNAELKPDQLIDYLKLAREHDVDALISISNDFATLPTHHPLQSEIPGTQTISVKLFHWSWYSILTEASILLHENQIKNPSHRYLLEELVRYLVDPASGARGFNAMNKEWSDIVSKINGARLKRSEPGVVETVSAWHQEMRDWALKMSRGTNNMVLVKIPRSHQANPKLRLAHDCKRLVEEKLLECELQVPDTAADIKVSTNIGERTITCSMEVAAPKNLKRQMASVNWLVRQIKRSDPKTMINIKWSRKSYSNTISLKDLLNSDNPIRHIHKDRSLLPRSFAIEQRKSFGIEFGSKKKFIVYLEKLVRKFYNEIGESVKPWIPNAPMLEADDPESEN